MSQSSPDKLKLISLSFLAGLIAAVITLDYYGYIQHSQATDALVIDEFKLMDLSTEQEVRVSSKASGKLAFCADGFLLLKPDNGKNVAGILVDAKNRGIRCD